MIALNQHAPAVTRESLKVDAEPNVVFATLADLSAWPAWQEGSPA